MHKLVTYPEAMVAEHFADTNKNITLSQSIEDFVEVTAARQVSQTASGVKTPLVGGSKCFKA